MREWRYLPPGMELAKTDDFPRTDALARIFPELRVVSFVHRQDRLIFFSMLNELIQPHHEVLDFGAGSGRQTQLGGRHLRSISCFKGRCRRLIGADVDPVVLSNPLLDKAVVLNKNSDLPFGDAQFDVIYSYAVFEHIDDPSALASELVRVLKPGGWLCAWTPNKWGYVGMAARMVPNRFHSRLLRAVEPGGRSEEDVFPTRYKMNTVRAIRRQFPQMEDYSFVLNCQPSYNFGSALVARLWLLWMTVLPRALGQGLFVFLRRKPVSSSSTRRERAAATPVASAR